MPANSPVPNLSQVQFWDTDHLTDAATHWTNTANLWEETFTQVSQQIPCPGGSPWDGAAAGAAQQRSHTDRLKVTGLAGQLHDASAVARSGADQIQAAKLGVLAAVGAADDAGFTVGQDFSVTSRQTGDASVMAARQAQAQAFAADIRTRVAELIAVDRQVAAKITSAASGVGAVGFAGTDPSADGQRDPTIQAVDHHTVKEAPPQPPPPDPPPGPLPPINDADDVRRALDPLQNGGKRGPNGVGTKPGIKEAWDNASIKQMWDYLIRNAADCPPPPGWDGATRVLPDGTKIGLRRSTQGWGDTLQVWYPDGSPGTKIHTPYAPYFPPFISAPPQLPPAAGPAPVPIPPPQVGHAPVALPPTGVFDPNGLPPWLQNPSSPGFHIPAQPPTIMPGVSLPDSPAAPTPAPGESSLLPDLGHDLAEAGTTAGAGVLAGVAIIGGLIAGGVTPSGQIAR
jgi:hypothetical protein